MKTQNKIFTRDFTLVVLGQIVSLFGNAILRFALPLYLLRQTGSAALFGLVSAVSFLPMIVLSLLGGVLADRVNKRNIMVVLDFCTAGIVLVFSALLGFAPLVPLLAATLMLLFGIQGAYQPAVQASIPALLPPERVLSGSAVINQISALASLVGPILGGMLMGTFGLTPILVISTICFFLSAVMEIFIHIPHTPRAMEGSAFAIVRGDLGQSMHYIRKDKPILLRVMGLAVLINLVLSAMLTIGLPVIITGTLGLGDAWMGWCEGTMAMGALLGGAAVALLGKWLQMSSVPLVLTGASLTMVPMGLALLPGIPVMVAYGIVVLSCVICMACATATSILVIGYVQVETPPELVGKVISCLMASSLCAQPVGQALYGIAFQQLAAIPWVVVFVCAALSVGISIYSRRTLHQL